jgi:hypothetical protein
LIVAETIVWVAGIIGVHIFMIMTYVVWFTAYL